MHNMVKTWEMEIFHKKRPQDFKTLKPDIYTVSLNGMFIHFFLLINQITSLNFAKQSNFEYIT